MELLLLLAIAYAGARGVEALAGTTDRRHHSKEADKTVAKVAATARKEGKETKPGPTERGGTFSAAAPRSAALGGKAAVPFAIVAETGATMWKALGEGYRQSLPQLREQHRQKMTQRAERRQGEKSAAAAQKKAEEAVKKAGPPPPHPPKPAQPPTPAPGPEANDAPTGGPAPLIPEQRPETGREALRTAFEEVLRERAESAERKAEAARKDAETTRSQAATEKVLAAQKAEREANERARQAEERARTAEADNKDRYAAETDTGRRRLTVVPDPAQNGDAMSSPAAIIPEIRTLDGLMNALTLTKAMCQMRAEEAEAIAGDDLALSNRLDQIESEMAELEVDEKTRAEVDTLRETIHAQSQAAAQYGGTAKDAADLATATAQAAYKSHGGIAEAVQSSPIEQAAQAGYYDR